jgi:hypothetical protein
MYASMKINHPDGKIKYGTYNLNLFKPPVNLRKRLQKDIVPDMVVKITLQMPDHQELDDLDEEEREQKKEEIKKKQEEQLQVVPYREGSINEIDIKHEY